MPMLLARMVKREVLLKTQMVTASLHSLKPISQQKISSSQLQLSQTQPVTILHRDRLKMHRILRRGPRAPARTRGLAITLQTLFYTA